MLTKCFEALQKQRSRFGPQLDMFKDKYSCILGVIILLCHNPVSLLIRAPDKRGYLGSFKGIFSYF